MFPLPLLDVVGARRVRRGPAARLDVVVASDRVVRGAVVEEPGERERRRLLGQPRPVLAVGRRRPRPRVPHRVAAEGRRLTRGCAHRAGARPPAPAPASAAGAGAMAGAGRALVSCSGSGYSSRAF